LNLKSGGVSTLGGLRGDCGAAQAVKKQETSFEHQQKTDNLEQRFSGILDSQASLSQSLL
jgi:hypothetical protein